MGLILSSGGLFVRQSGTICAILVGGIIRTVLRNYFEFGPAVQMSFKDISYLEFWQPFCLAERNHLCNFGRAHYGKHSCAISLNLDQLSF